MGAEAGRKWEGRGPRRGGPRKEAPESSRGSLDATCAQKACPPPLPGQGQEEPPGSLSAGTALGTRRILSAVEGGLKLKLAPQRLLLEARGEQSQGNGP